jgi:hypothetical protein
VSPRPAPAAEPVPEAPAEEEAARP